MSAEDELKKARKGYDNYLRYTGLGFTMLGIVLACTFGGWWLDQQLVWPFPIFTLVLSLLGIAGAMIYLFKETGKG
ncbi:MAG: AtpZ/AtpI family protein [Flavobacteriales bacterium]|nr:AtpZ/AtpI family protein [Flavobacteriales bacterium]